MKEHLTHFFKSIDVDLHGLFLDIITFAGVGGLGVFFGYLHEALGCIFVAVSIVVIVKKNFFNKNKKDDDLEEF